MKHQLQLGALSVDTFDVTDTPMLFDEMARAQGGNQTAACNTRQPFCIIVSVNNPCVTQDLACL